MNNKFLKQSRKNMKVYMKRLKIKNVLFAWIL